MRGKIKEKLWGYITAFIGANIESIYKNTGSFEVEKYIILLRQIAKVRINTNRLTTTDWKNRKIKVKKNTALTDEQLNAMHWVLENNDFIIKEVERLLKKIKNKELRKEKLKEQNGAYQEVISFFED